MAQRDDLAGGLPNPSPSSPSSNTPNANSTNLGGNQPGQEASGLKDEVKNLAQEAKDQTKQLADQAGNQLNQLVSRQKDMAAERLGGFAGALREAAGKLEQDEKIGNFGGYANRAAEQVDRFSNYLRDGDLSGFFRDAETTARRHPDLFLGGTFLAGLVLARFLKASNPRREALVPYDQGPQRFSSGFDRGTYGSSPSYTTERYPGAGDVSGRPYDPSPAGV